MQSDEQQHPQREDPTQAPIPDQIRAEHAQLEAALAGISDEQFIQPGAFGEWSVKDILAHITFWEQRLLAYFNGARESLIQPGEEEQAAIDRINAEVFTANRDRPLDEVRAAFASSYQQTLALADALSAEDLADEELFGLFAGDTFEHYREHREMLEQLKQ
jgi:uncharacterized protein (TIGR03083 family)